MKPSKFRRLAVPPSAQLSESFIVVNVLSTMLI